MTPRDQGKPAVPQIILTKAADGGLVVELPGPAGRRQVRLKSPSMRVIHKHLAHIQCDGCGRRQEQDIEVLVPPADDGLFAVLTRLLDATRDQGKTESRVGQDAAPTQAQVIHWERHCRGEPQFSDPMCVFCIAEGRFELTEEARAKAHRKIERQRRETRVVRGSGPDAVEIRRKPDYRSRFVLVRDENEALPVIMLREEAKAAGLRPIEAEQRTQASAEELGL